MNRKSISVGTLRASLATMALAMFVFMSAQPLHAQVDTGSVLGTVSDASGAPIRGAKVTLTNEGTAALLSTMTGADGIYKFTPVKIGNYKISASFQGFQTITQTGVEVNVGADVVVNFALKPGQVTEIVEVSAAPPVLETQNGSVGQVVDSKSVNELPLNGRNFTFLAQLVAGVNTPQADTRGNASTGAFAANGLRPAQNNYLLDGIDNNSDTVDFLNGTNFVVLPPVDAIQEFKVQTSGFSAEFGRSGAAILNATIKSGTNQLHGAIWEFFRNDKLDAADFFENANNIKKGEYRQNQFGLSAGGPVVIPHLFDGRNKVFFFADYEGLRRVQGTVHFGSVPSLVEINSGYTDFSDLILAQSTPTNDKTDALGRKVPVGTILDPATTRPVTAGAVDPVSGIVAVSSGYVRDPFGTCPASTMAFTLPACGLNNLAPAIASGRAMLDQNAIKLLGLYPKPTNNATGSLLSNFADTPATREQRNAFDSRMDINFSQKDTLFYRFSYVDDPQLIAAIFGGIPDGGGFQEGNQTANSQQSALGWTHTISPTLVNEARAGLSYLHTTRVSPAANNLAGAGGGGLPADYGILGIPQASENGGLPAFGISGLSTLGSNAFLPSDEVSTTFQFTDSVTKIYGKHTFKMGFEFQHVKFSTLQPPWSRGEFDFSGLYTEIPGVGGSNTGRVQMLLTPKTTNLAAGQGGIDYVGGPSGNADDGGLHNGIQISNISLTDNGKNYYGGFANDDWKITPKLTLNLGLRWDFFGLVFEHHGNQANFIPSGGPLNGPTYLMPGGKNTCDATTLSSDPTTGFIALLAKDGIQCAATNKYGKGLGNSQKANFAPRVGFAYQMNPKLVVRGGFGIFYNGFENRGFSPNLGENYPFQFNFSFQPPDAGHPVTYPGCTSAGATPIGSAKLETGFSCTPLSPLVVKAGGLALRGIQFDYLTPYSMGGNLTVQYQLTPSMSVQAAYVTSLARHLESFPGSNRPSQIVPTNLPSSIPFASYLPFPDFQAGPSYAATEGSSAYHGLQTKVEKQFAGGLNFLATYTFSRTRSDAGDLLNGGSLAGYRAPYVPGFGIQGDYGLANFDIRNVFHFSGGYELPFGKGKRFMSDASGVANRIVNGWSLIWIATLQGGQPITLTCPSGTGNGTGCYDLVVSGQSPKLGLHNDSHGKLSWIGNAAAFTQPPPCTLVAGTPTNCGLSALGGSPAQIPGPGFHRLDFSIFKDFPFNERVRLQFRSEIFNIFNHPNFNSPGFGGNGVVAISGSTNFTSSNFGEIGATRDAPHDPRQIQFALKLYY
ncbi:MAG TPA: TonB-dependent receptor [Candidatus Limnocylindria bacterium]|nr:TonB-dependent receptor [Candidatus Limnocylindria bacterium]